MFIWTVPVPVILSNNHELFNSEAVQGHDSARGRGQG